MADRQPRVPRPPRHPDQPRAARRPRLARLDRPGEDGHLLPLLSGEPVEIDPLLVSPDIHFLRQCVLAGIGIGFIPDAQLPDPGVDPGALVPILPEIVGRERRLHMLVPAALAGFPKLRALLLHIQAFIASTVPAPAP